MCRAGSPQDKEFTPTGGNEDVQEALLEQLRLQLQNEAFKEEVKDDLKGRVERLREIEAEVWYCAGPLLLPVQAQNLRGACPYS
jgi:hypothetical protein